MILWAVTWSKRLKERLQISQVYGRFSEWAKRGVRRWECQVKVLEKCFQGRTIVPEWVIMWRFSWLVEMNFLSQAWQSNISCTCNKRDNEGWTFCLSLWYFQKSRIWRHNTYHDTGATIWYFVIYCNTIGTVIYWGIFYRHFIYILLYVNSLSSSFLQA